uniref:Zinc finger, CCHC-type n=1 Tax=Tanacetum cinerariifolium TaxID=118510 RepID=A0A6L2M612_TANCI|nr:hypothetical protein [Tanacetum cinerariifolium]
MFKKQNKDKRTHPDTAAPTPPPPPRSFLNNIFKPGNKNKKISSSKTSPLPPLPPTRSRPQPRPPPQPKPQPQHYYQQSSVSSSSQSSYIPQPPPLPPFDMPANKYKYIGQYFARLRSFNSNTSSSPDLQPMGQPSTSTDSGDMLWSSPDVNAKAGIFISKGKDIWKIEQENRVEKKGGPSLRLKYLLVLIMANSVKDMTTKFGKLDKFEGIDFRRWQKKRHFLLTTLKVAYVLSTPKLEFVEEETLDQTRVGQRRLHMSMAHLERSMMEQYHELLRILGQYTQHGLFMDESILVSSIIDKLPPSWKDFKDMLKHNKDELSLVQLGSHFCIEETLRMEESGKGKGKDIVGSSSVNTVKDDKNKNNNKNSNGNKRKFHEKKNDSNKKSMMAMMKLLGGLTRVQLVMHVRIVDGLIPVRTTEVSVTFINIVR